MEKPPAESPPAATRLVPPVIRDRELMRAMLYRRMLADASHRPQPRSSSAARISAGSVREP